MKNILAFFVCTVLCINNVFSQYTVTSCQTVTDALIGPDRNDFVHNNAAFPIYESYLHNFTPPTLPICINNANITSLLISVDITDITTSPECSGIVLFGNVLRNCVLTTTAVCPITEDILTTGGCNTFGGGQTNPGIYSLDLANCEAVNNSDIIGVDIVPATGGNPCPESTTGISDDLVNLTYEICIQYTYDQDTTVPCTNTTTIPCNDDDDCTINDVVIVDECDNSIICSPCVGEVISISVNMTVADSPLIAGDSTELIFTFSGGVAPYTIYYTANGVLDSLTNVLMSPAIDTIFPVMTTTYQFINIIDDNGCTADGLAPIIIELPVCPSSDEVLGISGPTDVCAFDIANYSVNEISGVTSYNWNVNGGSILVGQGTSSIDVEFFSGIAGIADISVSTESDCGAGPTSSPFEVFVLPITFPDIQGNFIVCQNSIESYETFDEGGCYEWTVPDGATIIEGQNTSTIIVDWGTAEDGLVTVTDWCSCFPQIDERFITVIQEPNALIQSPENLSCENQIVTLDGSMSTGESFEWQDGVGNIVGTNSTLDVSNSDIYTLTMSSTQFGLTCTNTATETVLEVPDVEPPLVTCPDNLSISIPIGSTGVIVEDNLALLDYSDNCGISSVEYVVSGATNISNSGDNAEGNFFNTGTSTIQYVVTDDSGFPAVCSFELTISADEDPCASAAGAATFASISTYEICEGECTTLSISDPFGGLAPFKFFYNVDGVLDSFENVVSFPFTQEFCLTQSTGFRVLYGLDANGCIIESEGLLQTVHVYPNPTVDLGEDVNLCNDESINLSPSISSNASNISFATTLNFYFAPWINDSNNPMFADLEISGLPNTTITDPVNEIVSVCLNLETDAVQDIDLYLVAPNGVELELSTGNGGDEEDYVNTCFTPTAPTSITTGTAPFTGDFQPEGNWNDLIGSNFNGTWSLRVSDNGGSQAGILNYWQINFDIQNNLNYSWSPNNETSSSIEAESGVYSVTVSGGNCSGSDEIELFNNTASADIAPFSNLSCNNPTVILDGINSIGDSFEWLDEAGLLIGTSSNLEVSTPACYTLIVYNNSVTPACSNEITVCVTEEGESFPYAGESSEISLCESSTSINLFDFLGENADENGLWTPSLSGGYLGIFTPNNNTVGAYTYSVSNSCGTANAVLEVIISEFEIMAQITDVSCFGESNGSVSFSSNGTNPLSYSEISFGSLSGDEITNISAGNYAVTVTDAQGCEKQTQFTVNQPADISVNAEIIDETCTFGNDGSIELNITGGTITNAYSIVWTNIQGEVIGTTDFPQNLPAGSYSLQVSDNNNCLFSDDYLVALPATPIILSVEEDSLECTSIPNGQLSINVNPNGSNNLTYQWSNGEEGSSTISDLEPGIYSVSVTNEDECSVSSELRVAGEILPSAFAGEDMFYCQEDEFYLSAQLPFDITGEWYFPVELFLENNTNPNSQVVDYQEGSFDLIWSVSNEECPDYDRDTLKITIPTFPIANKDSLIFSFVKNRFINEAGIIQVVDISNNDTFDSNTQSIEILTPPENGKAEWNNNSLNYSTDSRIVVDQLKYLIFDENCPNLKDTATVFIKIQDFPDNIIGITPGRRDNINDFLKFPGIENFPNNRILIHNRWGDIVFEQEGYNNNWDGSFQKTNKPLPAGTYYYSLWLDIGEGEIEYGAVVIIR